jgi:hypothetical protein
LGISISGIAGQLLKAFHQGSLTAQGAECLGHGTQMADKETQMPHNDLNGLKPQR